MNAVDTSSNSPSSDNASRRLDAVEMPIEEPVGDFDEAVQKLRQCSLRELRRAHQRHRRALESLKQGSYSALSESTRDQLMGDLRRNLKALNHALDATARASDAPDPSEDASSFSSRFRAFFQALW